MDTVDNILNTFGIKLRDDNCLELNLLECDYFNVDADLFFEFAEPLAFYLVDSWIKHLNISKKFSGRLKNQVEFERWSTCALSHISQNIKGLYGGSYDHILEQIHIDSSASLPKSLTDWASNIRSIIDAINLEENPDDIANALVRKLMSYQDHVFVEAIRIQSSHICKTPDLVKISYLFRDNNGGLVEVDCYQCNRCSAIIRDNGTCDCKKDCPKCQMCDYDDDAMYDDEPQEEYVTSFWEDFFGERDP